MTPKISIHEPETFIDIHAAASALDSLADALGCPASYPDRALMNHTSDDTFLRIIRLEKGYYWGTFSTS